jgi:hypothetical protein
MSLGHSRTDIATRAVEAQGCPGLVAKAGERWLVGKAPGATNHWETGPNEASNLGKGLGGKAPEVK